jgi:hypothetical protein
MGSTLKHESLPETIGVNPACKISTMSIGQEGNTIILVDDFLSTPESLINLAKNAGKFIDEGDNYYPGQRVDVPQVYSQLLENYFSGNIAALLNAPHEASPKVVESKFCIATKTPAELVPIQSIPHFDTSDVNQIAAVHYLCDSPFQGTSFYQHRTSGFESISPERSKAYFKWLSREAITTGLPKSGYIMGDTELFKRVKKVDCKFNRIIFYKSNMLHAGDIDAETDLSEDPLSGRLTANSFIRLSPDTAQTN